MTRLWPSFRDRWIGKTAAISVLLVGLMVTALIWQTETSKARAALEARIVEQVNSLALRIQQRLFAYEIVLRGGGALFAATAYPSREQWRVYVNALRLDRAYSGIQAVGFAAWLKPEHVANFEAQVRTEGFGQFRVWPAGPRAEVSSILYIEPFDAVNLRAFGYDMYAEGTRRQAMQLARDGGTPALTAPISLVQDVGGAQRISVLMYLPLYRYGASIETEEQRRQSLIGWIYAPFRPAELLASAARDIERPLRIRLFDGRGTDGRPSLLADEAPGEPIIEGQSVIGASIEVPGRIWTLEARVPASLYAIGTRRPWESLVGGVLISLLLFAVVWSMATTQDRAQGLASSMTQQLRRANEELDWRVQVRTAEITAANEQLRQEIAERERLESERADALSRERALNAQLRALTDASLGVSLSADHGARLEYLAERACHIAGCSYAVLVGEAGGERAVSIASMLPMSGRERRELMQAAQRWPPADRIEVGEAPAFGVRSADPAAKAEEMLRVPVHLGRERRLGSLYLLHSGGKRFSDEDQVIVRQLVLMVTAAMATAEAVESERQARIEAEAANNTKDEFLAVVSHELRTPLHAIVGWLHVIERKGASGEHLTRAIDVIRRNAEAQSALVDDLLDLARLERGKLVVNMEPLAFDELVVASVESHRQVAAGKGVELRLRCEARGRVEGDPLRLMQAVNNLVGNALKFTSAGGHVDLRLMRERDQFVLEVADDGDGIEPGMLAHVFDRFRQADSSSRRRQGGLGLGLALVKHIIEMHGGRVEAASAGKGRGAVFTLRLPALSDARQDHDAADAAGAQAALASAPRGLVMIIDDHEDAREAVGHWLIAEGFSLASFGSVDTAIRWLEHQDAAQWPRAVLCDIEMPEHDGYEFLRALRALEAGMPARPHVGPLPVVALTAYAGANDRARAIASGFAAHLSKPVAPQRLVRTLEQLMT